MGRILHFTLSASVAFFLRRNTTKYRDFLIRFGKSRWEVFPKLATQPIVECKAALSRQIGKSISLFPLPSLWRALLRVQPICYQRQAGLAAVRSSAADNDALRYHLFPSLKLVR
jgi:hypothetical protein